MRMGRGCAGDDGRGDDSREDEGREGTIVARGCTPRSGYNALTGLAKMRSTS